jgi:hypothetical protein
VYLIYIDIYIYIQVIHKSLRDIRPLLYSSRDGHTEGKHVTRGRDTPIFCPTLQVLDSSFLLCLSWLLCSRFRKFRRDYDLPGWLSVISWNIYLFLAIRHVNALQTMNSLHKAIREYKKLDTPDRTNCYKRSIASDTTSDVNAIKKIT